MISDSSSMGKGVWLLMSAISVYVGICFLKVRLRHLLTCSKNPQKINFQTSIAHPTKEYKLTIPVHAWGEVQRSRSLTRVLRAGPGWSVCIKVTGVLQLALCRMCGFPALTGGCLLQTRSKIKRKKRERVRKRKEE